jgi:hypothetical protein
MAKTTQNTETTSNEVPTTPDRAGNVPLVGKMVDTTASVVLPTETSKVEPVAPKGTKEYNVLHFPSADKLQNAVTNALNRGWQLVGGICVAHVSTQYSVSTTFSQSITRG